MKLGDLVADRARRLAAVARRFSAGELRTSIEQNIYLPWVREGELGELYLALKELGLGEAGAETVSDVTTCPGADTCRLGIASAKGLGSVISEAFELELAEHYELARALKVKISGCPNGCAQHGIANIGFHAAALSQGGRTVPAYLVFLGGEVNVDEAAIGRVIGKFPARNGVKVMKALLDLYSRERRGTENFNACMERLGDARIKGTLEPLRAVPSLAAVMTRRPSGLNPALSTGPSWPFKIAISLSSATSQMRAKIHSVSLVRGTQNKWLSLMRPPSPCGITLRSAVSS